MSGMGVYTLMDKKLTYEFVKNSFKKEGYKLLSKEYRGPHRKLDYICPKGHECNTTWAKWYYANQKCVYCSKRPPIKLDGIKKSFEEEGYVLLSTKYINRKKLEYVCSSNHYGAMTWDNWKYNKRRCPVCMGNAPPTFGEIKNSFKLVDYKLLSGIYTNSNTKLNYVCTRGHKSNVTWAHWSRGVRCRKCWYIDLSGSGHWNWKGGISCEPYCDVWLDKEYKEDIKKRDNHKCQNIYCWETSERLCIHHIDYDKKNCNPWNLITLCNSCNVRANKNRDYYTNYYTIVMKKRGVYEQAR